jgi:hypothetical protein
MIPIWIWNKGNSARKDALPKGEKCEGKILNTQFISSSMKICDVGVLIPTIIKLSILRPYSLRDILHIFKEFEYVII